MCPTRLAFTLFSLKVAWSGKSHIEGSLPFAVTSTPLQKESACLLTVLGWRHGGGEGEAGEGTR